MTAAVLPVVAASGLTAEARIARGAGVVTVAGGGDAARFALLLQGALAGGARGVISFGIAGGLEPGLAPGTAVIGRRVDDGVTGMRSDEGWVARLAERLPGARIGDLAGTDRVVAGAEGKRALYRATGALAVDMESHVAARLAAQYGVPFVALRIVADPAHRALPHAATVGLRPDGRMDGRAVARALARRPGDIPALVRTALDARAAFLALRRSRKALCGVLGFDREDGPAIPAPAAFLLPVGSDTGLFDVGGGEVGLENS